MYIDRDAWLFCLISTSTLNPPIYYKPMCTNMSARTNGCIPYMLFITRGPWATSLT